MLFRQSLRPADVVGDQPVVKTVMPATAIRTQMGATVWAHLLSGRSLLVPAVAGAGKTSLAREVIDRMAPSQRRRTCFIALNRDLIDQLRLQLPGVQVTTLHAFALRQLRTVMPSTAVDPGKIATAILARLTREATHVVALRAALCQTSLASLADDLRPVITAMVAQGDDLEQALARTTGQVTHDAVARLVADRIVRDLAEDVERVGFEEVVPWVNAKQLRLPRFSYLIIDEAQDFGPHDLALLERLMEGARVLILGDERQSVYGFRGAVANGMRRLGAQCQAEIAPLTTSRRCPQAVVDLARVVQPAMSAAQGAPMGEVVSATKSAWSQWSSALQSGDLVLAQRGAWLIPFAVDLYRRGQPVSVRSSLGERLLRQAERILGGASLPAADWDARCVAAAAARVGDQRALIEAVRSLGGGLAMVDLRLLTLRWEALTTEQSHAVRFSTIHQAKGLEAPTVIWLAPEAIDAASEEEVNLAYVAITRAQQRLVLMSLDGVERGREVITRLVSMPEVA
jgi:hypothetical protein